MSVFHSLEGKDKIKELLQRERIKIHFVGAGGVGIYSLLKISVRLGYEVTGSDREISSLCNRLIDDGFKIYVGHSKENVQGKDLLVYSLAISEDNPELQYALENQIPSISRAEYLGILMENYSERISVSGSHGKSTTTAMISSIFEAAGRSPTVILGANLPHGDEPLLVGKEDFLRLEVYQRN